jgi:hypothetical protein
MEKHALNIVSERWVVISKVVHLGQREPVIALAAVSLLVLQLQSIPKDRAEDYAKK